MMKSALLATTVTMLGAQVAMAADIPNNNKTTASVPIVATKTAGVSEIAGDSDWYKVALKTSYSYSFAVAADSCTTINLRDSKGKVVKTSKACKSASGGYDGGFDYRPSKNGTYFVELVDVPPSGTYPTKYSVTVYYDASGDSKTNALIKVGETSPKDMDWKNDVDFFKTTLAAGTTYAMEISSYYNMSNISLRLADSKGKFLKGYDKLGSVKYDQVKVPEAGTYFLVATGTGNGTGGDYTLSLKTKNDIPEPPEGVIREGTYKAADGAVCEVTNFNLSSAKRIRSFFNCTDRTNDHVELSVVTGSISAGHPYLNQLTSLGINSLSDVDQYFWGLTTSGTFLTCNRYINAGAAVGAQITGNLLVLYFYASGPSFLCSTSFSRQ